MIKPRNEHPHNAISQSTGFVPLLPSVSLISFSSPGAHIVFSCLVSHASSNLGHTLTLPLPFMPMTLGKNASQSFCRMSLNMGLCDWMEVMHIWQKYHRSDSLPVCIVSGGAWCPRIIGDVSFDPLRGFLQISCFSAYICPLVLALAFDYGLHPF